MINKKNIKPNHLKQKKADTQPEHLNNDMDVSEDSMDYLLNILENKPKFQNKKRLKFNENDQNCNWKMGNGQSKNNKRKFNRIGKKKTNGLFKKKKLKNSE